MENNLKDKIAVLGLGVEGKDVVRYLLKKKYCNITVLDKKNRSELDLKDLDCANIKFITGSDYLKNGLTEYKTIFRSPGVYRYLPEILEAQKKGSIITSNINLFLNEFKGKTIGVTGTKGKGTTSTLIYNILRKTNKNVFLVGNIGNPPLEILKKTNSISIAVLELSSFQLIDLKISCDISVVLNITSDHMDWHKDQEEYVNAKKNIVKHQDTKDFKVLNYDYKNSRVFASLSKSGNFYFSKNAEVNGVYIKDGLIYTNLTGKTQKVGDTKKLLLRGRHNWENISAASCAALLCGASIANVRNAVFSFKGLEHRLEEVSQIDKVRYYNDSFSTNPQTTIAAVDAFEEELTLILGGYDKGLAFDDMVRHLSKKNNLMNIILIGNVSDKLFNLLSKHNFKGNVVRLGKSDMRTIVQTSQSITPRGGIVLLSPACASFDMFKNYKDRGEKFKQAVHNIVS